MDKTPTQYTGSRVIGCTIEPRVNLLTPGACLAMQRRTKKAMKGIGVAGAGAIENARFNLSPKRFCQKSCPNWAKTEGELVTGTNRAETAAEPRTDREDKEKPRVWLNNERTKRNWDQSRLAEMLGVHRSTISSWETGRYSPDKQHLKKLAEIFGAVPPSPQLIAQGLGAINAPTE